MSQDDESHPTDEEQVETEWHFWLIALLVVAGGLLVAFPPAFWPDVGYALVGLAVVAWITKTLIERGNR